jgi:hypothetical protein
MDMRNGFWKIKLSTAFRFGHNSLFAAGFWFLSNSFALQSQKYSFEKWDAASLAQANSAKDINYFTEDEEKVIFYLNLVRMDPKLFGETYLRQYLDSVKMKKNSYVSSLEKELKSAKKMKPLQPLKLLFESAESHAIKMGKTGGIGHADFDKRFAKVSKQYGGYVGENCDYGNKEPLDIVMSLLIDDGVPGMGHRKNILNEQYVLVGVSIKPHKKDEWNCVIDFSGDSK